MDDDTDGSTVDRDDTTDVDRPDHDDAQSTAPATSGQSDADSQAERNREDESPG